LIANKGKVHGELRACKWLRRTGDELQPVASLIQAMGNDVRTPKIKGNQPGDSKNGRLVTSHRIHRRYLEETGSKDAILVGTATV
jgi:hypothetical protein